LRDPVIGREPMPVPEKTTQLDNWILDEGAFPPRDFNPMPEHVTRLDEWILDLSAFPSRVPRLP
jgi:hypothetical protein